VIAYFVSHGVPAARLVGMPRGDANPVADNSTPEGRRLNRRIEFVINNLVG
jgi:outer membrane protein OmpA-like peptidoglycan-associated protein